MSRKVPVPEFLKKKNIYHSFADLDLWEFRDTVSGDTISRYIITRPDAAAILLFNTDSQSFIFIRQFRAPVFSRDNQGIILEIPAGVLEKNESPEDCIIRETLEETGYQIDNPFYLGEIYPSCGLMNERIHLFYKEVNYSQKVKSGGGLDKEHEYLELVEIPKADINSYLKNGKIKDAKAMASLLYYFTILDS